MLMGIDQSLTSTGVTLFDGKKYFFYLLQSKKTRGTQAPTIDYTRRLMDLKHQVAQLIEKHQVDRVAIEGMAFGAQGQAVFDLGGLSHIFRELFIEKGIPFAVVPPTVLKKYWTGKGNAKKEEMIAEAVKRGYDIPFKKRINKVEMFDDNITDSLALCQFLQDIWKPEWADKAEKSWEI